LRFNASIKDASKGHGHGYRLDAEELPYAVPRRLHGLAEQRSLHHPP
jgi:hypothetical protein